MAIQEYKVRVGADLRPFDRGIVQLNQKMEDVKRDVRQKYGEITQGLGNMGRSLTMGVTLPIVALGTAAVGAALRMDTLTRGLTSVAGSSDAAKEQMARLKEVAKLPGLGFEEAVQGSVRLQSVGETAQEAERNMKAFGNALATIGYGKAEMAAVITQLMQMESIGRVLTMDVKIIQQYVPQLGKAMKAAFGTANAEEIGKMGVSSKEFIKAVVTELEKLPKVTSGIKVDLENTADEANRALATLGKQMVPTVRDLAQEATRLLQAFEKLPASSQQWILKLAIGAAVFGPMLTTVNNLVTAGTNAKAIIVWLIGKIAARSAAAATEAVAVGAETAAEVANTVAKGANATATTALATVTAGHTTAIVAQTAAVTANTTAWAALMATLGAPVALATVGAVAGIGAAVVAGLGYGIHHYGKQAREAQDNIRKTMGGEQDAFRKTYAKHSTEQLERDLERQKAVRADAIARRKEYDESSWWSKWQPANKVAKESADYDYETANKRVLWLKKELAARQQQTEAAKQLSEEARKLIAENDKANRAALQEKYILSQRNEHDRAIAEAWVELTNRKAEIAARTKEALEQHGVALDVSDQLKTAQYAYDQKVREANEAARQTALDQQAAAVAAGMELQALRTRNVFEQERLRIQADLVRTMRELQSQKASETEILVARAQAEQQIQNVNQREAIQRQSAEVAEAAARARGKAIRSGDEYALADIDAAERFIQSVQDLARRWQQGEPVAGSLEEAQERFFAALRKTQDQRVKDAADKQKEAYQKRLQAYERDLETWQETVRALGEKAALAFEGAGDTRSAGVARLGAESAIREEEIARKMREAQTPEQKRLAGLLKENWAVEKQQKLFELLTGGVQNFYDKLRARKDEAVRGWQEQAQAARSYYDQLRSRLTLSTMDQVWRESMESGLRASVREPMMPPPPSTQITQGDIDSLLREGNTGDQQRLDELKMIRYALEHLVPISGWNGA